MGIDPQELADMPGSSQLLRFEPIVETCFGHDPAFTDQTLKWFRAALGDLLPLSNLL